MTGGGRHALQAAAAAALLGLGAVGCGDAPRETLPPKATIVVADDAYLPSNVRIPVGGRVTFAGRGTAPNTAETDRENVFEFDRDKLDRHEQFDLHSIERGEAETVEFDTPGSYSFHSSFNGTMWGVIEVVEPSP